MLRDHEQTGSKDAAGSGEQVNQQPQQDQSLRFTNAGPLPGVPQGQELAMVSASDRAYGRGDQMQDEMATDSHAIEAASRAYGIPAVDIAAIVTQESRGNAHANAGASQKDHGAHAASGLMQVTQDTWENTQARHPELAKYSFSAYRYDRTVNILVGTAALADKRHALEGLGVNTAGNAAALLVMAYNAGEGIVADAYHRAQHAGEQHPEVACMRAEYLKPAIGKYPSVYSYYLTGGGKSKNPHHSKDRAIELKYEEISKYPNAVEMLVADGREHGMADTEQDVPMREQTELAETENKTTAAT